MTLVISKTDKPDLFKHHLPDIFKPYLDISFDNLSAMEEFLDFPFPVFHLVKHISLNNKKISDTINLSDMI